MGYGHAVEGYASKTSINYKNDTIDLYVRAPLTAPGTYDLEVFRMGWYGGRGARKVYERLGISAQTQPSCPVITDPTSGLVECNWNPLTPQLSTASFSSPVDGPVSGYYLVKLSSPNRQAPTGGQAYIIFVVREDDRARTFLMNAPVTTYQAYNEWGAHSLYMAANQVSFDRPYVRNDGAGNFLDTAPGRYPSPDTTWPADGYEYLMVRFLERGPPRNDGDAVSYDVAYATDIDLHSNPSLLTNPNSPRNAFLSVGHDEYWSKPMHDNLEVARDLGKHIAFFSGNSVYWIIDVLPSLNHPERPNRRIETHKDLAAWAWQNCSLPRSNGAVTCPGEESEQTLVGSLTTDGRYDRGDMVFNAADVNHWVLSGSKLVDGSRIPGIIGYEAQTVCGTDQQAYPDCDPAQTHRPVPQNQTILAHSQFKARPQTFAPQYLYADMSVYQANSLAWVFSSGSPDWSLGLDIYTTDFPGGSFFRVHPAIGQMTRNILAQFGNLPFPPALASSAYTVTVSRPNPPQYHLSWTNLAGRPAGDRIHVYDVMSNDDSPIEYASCDVDPRFTAGSCDRTLPAGVTATADYVTLDISWGSNYCHPVQEVCEQDQLRTIWRAAKSPQFTTVP